MEEVAMVVVAGGVVIMTPSCTKYVEPSNVCRHQALPGTKVVAMHSFFCKRGYSLIRHHNPKKQLQHGVRLQLRHREHASAVESIEAVRTAVRGRALERDAHPTARLPSWWDQLPG